MGLAVPCCAALMCAIMDACGTDAKSPVIAGMLISRVDEGMRGGCAIALGVRRSIARTIGVVSAQIFRASFSLRPGWPGSEKNLGKKIPIIT